MHNYTTADFVGAIDWLLAHGDAVCVAQLASAPVRLGEIERAFADMQRGDFARVVVSAVGS